MFIKIITSIVSFNVKIYLNVFFFFAQNSVKCENELL